VLVFLLNHCLVKGFEAIFEEATRMLLGKMVESFVERAPLAVMTRIAVEHLVSPNLVNDLFERHAHRQYTRELTLATLTRLMSLVTLDSLPSLRAAYQEDEESVGTSIAAVYDKVNGVEPAVCQALVAETAQRCAEMIGELKAVPASLLPGYNVRILDGNHFSGTEHRLSELRTMRAGALPSQALVVLDPRRQLATHVIPCEDAHAQERSLLDSVLPLVGLKDLWIADRNFCTTRFLFGIADRRGSFLIRQHRSTLTWKLLKSPVKRGRTASGQVFEQPVELTEAATGRTLKVHRVTLKLDNPTRDGETEIHLLTNLPASAAPAARVADLYAKRWSVERLFLELTETLTCEVRTLGYPRAAIFAFCLALLAWNLISVVKAALRSVHGAQTIDDNLSGYYVSLEISRTTPGMMIAIPPEEWRAYQTMPTAQVAKTLCEIAKSVRLSKYQKHPRGPKKPKPKKQSGAKIKHVSTARLLAARSGYN